MSESVKVFQPAHSARTLDEMMPNIERGNVEIRVTLPRSSKIALEKIHVFLGKDASTAMPQFTIENGSAKLHGLRVQSGKSGLDNPIKKLNDLLKKNAPELAHNVTSDTHDVTFSSAQLDAIVAALPKRAAAVAAR